MLSIERSFRNDSIFNKIAGPRKIGPSESANGSVQVSRLTSIKISSISEEIPFNGSDKSALRLFEVNISKFHSWVGDERTAQTLFKILQISARSEVAK